MLFKVKKERKLYDKKKKVNIKMKRKKRKEKFFFLKKESSILLFLILCPKEKMTWSFVWFYLFSE